MYVYRKTDPGLWTVGFFRPDNTWEPEGDHDTPEKAAQRVHWLNGGSVPEEVNPFLLHGAELARAALARADGRAEG